MASFIYVLFSIEAKGMVKNINISSILKEREKTIKDTLETLAYLDETLRILNELNQHQKELAAYHHIDDKSKKTLQDIGGDLSKAISSYKQEKKVWKNLCARFSRDKIHIGVIGRQRQGKSTFLQNLTNLKSEIIPARDGVACTSVQSIIYHTDDKDTAEVIYYDEKEFIEQVIQPYIDKLNTDYNITKKTISSINELKRLDLKTPGYYKSYKSVAEGWYESFYNIWKNVKDYEADVKSKQKSKLIDPDEIKNYVQYNYDDKRKLESYNYLGIKKVVIRCKFKNHAIHQLGVIDLPGLGATRLGDRERLIRALGEDVDFVLYIKYPPSNNSDWEDHDSELYQAANTILSDKLPFKEWSFILINKDKENEAMCDQLIQTIESKSEIGFADMIKADANNEEDANEVLNQAIVYLSDHIYRLDKTLIGKCKESLYQIAAKLRSVINKAGNIAFTQDVETNFFLKFDEFYEELLNVIVKYRDKIDASNEDDDEWFNAEIEKVIQRTKESISFPTEEKFIRKSNRELTAFKPYHVLVHHVRSEILRNFHEFTNKQQMRIDQQKADIVSLLRTPELFGNLHGSSQLTDLEFLHYFKQRIEENGNFKDTGILKGFEFLCRFQVSYESSIQELVYGIIIQFFSDKIRQLNLVPDLDPLYVQSEKIVNTQLNQTDQNSGGNKEVATEKQSNSLDFIKRNTEDLTKICVSVIGLFPGAEMVTNVYDICTCILNIINSNKAVAEKEAETEIEINKLKKAVFDTDLKKPKELEHESLENLKKTVFYVLDMCKQELTHTIGNSTKKIRVSMTKEFLDHLVYTEDAEFEWWKFVKSIRTEIWENFNLDTDFGKKLDNWNILVKELEMLSQKASLNSVGN